MAIYLNITDGDKKHRLELTTKTLILGRSSSCHIKLQDPMISGKHLAVKLSPSGQSLLKDLETTNGTFINGYKVEETLLYLDDEINIGKIKMKLEREAMTPKEAELHNREGGKSAISFIDLSENKSSSKKIDDNLSDDLDDPKTKVASIKAELLKTETIQKKTMEDKKASKKGEIVVEENEEEVIEAVKEDRRSIDEIPDSSSLKIETKKKNKKKAIRPTKEEDKNKSIASKIKNLFKN